MYKRDRSAAWRALLHFPAMRLRSVCVQGPLLESQLWSPDHFFKWRSKWERLRTQYLCWRSRKNSFGSLIFLKALLHDDVILRNGFSVSFRFPHDPDGYCHVCVKLRMPFLESFTFRSEICNHPYFFQHLGKCPSFWYLILWREFSPRCLAFWSWFNY